MNFLNIKVDIANLPELDKSFIPLGAFIEAYLKDAKKPVSFAVFRNRGLVTVFDTFLHGTPEMQQADFYYTERLIKFLLWARGGAKIIVYGDDAVAGHLENTYSPKGARAFDCEFMSNVYGETFIIESKPFSERIKSNEESLSAGGNWDGCRIGFDAGGSDRKVSAVIDGKAVYSEEVVWYPKTNSDPDYHYNGIVEAMKTAASKMPRVDAIGVSSAGIYLDNHTMVASLFLKVPKGDFEEKIKDIYIRAAKEFGDVPLVVANDGDVTALAGAMELGEGRVLGIAMGTSEAAGYVDSENGITGWLNELAFAPVDCSPIAMVDEWSGDRGCGVKYFSQDGIIKLAGFAGIPLNEDDPPAKKLAAVQTFMEQGDSRAVAVYRSLGVYFGHTVALYARFYEIRHILLLGRVMSGEGGGIIVKETRRVLKEEYPSLADRVNISLPEEGSRRIGQSVAAAGLPILNI